MGSQGFLVKPCRIFMVLYVVLKRMNHTSAVACFHWRQLSWITNQEGDSRASLMLSHSNQYQNCRRISWLRSHESTDMVAIL
uniref:Uncharacterized protein n=1 Tax=Physcomitrium patens TaxID=3218 RepID=A0A2K1JYI5_PHYPA|nr:hypothetical protein PHYPA_013707 [Physcomitrium patens]